MGQPHNATEGTPDGWDDAYEYATGDARIRSRLARLAEDADLARADLEIAIVPVLEEKAGPRCVSDGRRAGGGWRQPSRHQSLTVSVNLPFILFTFRLLSTHVGCLLATGVLGTKHPFVLLQCWCVSSHLLQF